MKSIAVIVPTIESRAEIFEDFMKSWQPLFDKHQVALYKVLDGETPSLKVVEFVEPQLTRRATPADNGPLIYNYNDGVRNLGFYYAYEDGHDIFITLDDDVRPHGDTIQDHLDTLGKKVPVTWLSTTTPDYPYMRGFPYNVREEAKVVLSHGTWLNNPDYDAPTQLVHGNKPVEFYKGPIPKGTLYPMCIMNVAFTREAMPFMYQAPMGKKLENEKGWKLDRFADIWSGIESKLDIDKAGYAVYTGGAQVVHTRASNVWTNLKKETNGLEINEDYLTSDYRKWYTKKRNEWKKLLS